MATYGEIEPMPDLAIFADTGWEPRRVYEGLEWLSSPNVLPLPVRVVSAGNIREISCAAREEKRWASIPAFSNTVTPAGTKVLQYGDDADGEQVPVAWIARVAPRR